MKKKKKHSDHYLAEETQPHRSLGDMLLEEPGRRKKHQSPSRSRSWKKLWTKNNIELISAIIGLISAVMGLLPNPEGQPQFCSWIGICGNNFSESRI